METYRFKKVAAILCLCYILVQSFQWWVFSKFPEGDAVRNFLDGHHPLHILRNTLMLISMFGLWFIYAVVCTIQFSKLKFYSVLAFLCFSIFCFLEICLRSIELFYVQIDLPAQYPDTRMPAQSTIIEQVKTFYQLQSALYFPLGLGWMLGSAIIALTAARQKNNFLLIASFSFNAIRICFRILTVYAGFNILPDNIYSRLYLPMVIITFGLLGLWFLRREKHIKEQIEPRV